MSVVPPGKFYAPPNPAARRFRLQKLAGKPVPKAVQSIHGTVVLNPEVKRKTRTAQRKSRAKVPEEPEILTLSSDDEDKKEEAAKKLSAISNNNGNADLDAEAKAIAASGEPDCADEMLKNPLAVEGGGMMEQAVNGSIPHPHVMLSCRTVRIGTYKVKPSERVTISSQGIEMKVPSPNNDTPDIRISLPMSAIKKVLVSFCRTMPVVFLYLRSEGGNFVRDLLLMTDKMGSCYFDPDAYEESHKRITLLPDKMPDEFKSTLKIILQGLLSEINNKLANDILVKSSPHESSSLRHRLSLPSGEIRTIMVYPPPPAKGGISINTEDYACLGEDQFLNDVIIDFFLKYLMQSVLSEEDRERTHVFSSFFYKRLTSRPKVKGRRHPIEDDPKLSSAQKRHARVKGWTKSVNLFTKDFIIIPINESCHWFLAIICFPGQDGCRRMSDGSPVDVPVTSTSPAVAVAAAATATTNAKLKVQNNIMSIGSTTITPVKAVPPATITLDHNGDEGSDRDEAEGDEEEMEESASEEEEPCSSTTTESNIPAVKEPKEEPPVTKPSGNVEKSRKSKPLPREGIKQPCILIFDSLVGAPRYRVVATLRDYLSIEYKTKEGKEKEFTKYSIKGMLPKVPQQNNFTDCGLYVLQYVESFFKKPIKDYHSPIKELQDWFPEEVVTRKREEIMLLLHDLMLEQNIDRKSLSLPVLNFSHNAAAQLQAQQEAEDAEAAARLAEAEAEADAEEAHAMTKHESIDAQEAEVSSTPSTLNQPVSKVESSSCDSATVSLQVQTSGNGSMSVIKRVSGDNEVVDVGTTLFSPTVSLVDYSESDSSTESMTEQQSIKRGTDLEDTIDRKKRKFVSNE